MLTKEVFRMVHDTWLASVRQIAEIIMIVMNVIAVSL